MLAVSTWHRAKRWFLVASKRSRQAAAAMQLLHRQLMTLLRLQRRTLTPTFKSNSHDSVVNIKCNPIDRWSVGFFDAPIGPAISSVVDDPVDNLGS